MARRGFLLKAGHAILVHYKDSISYFKAFFMASDVSDKIKTKAYVVPEGFLWMGTMKSHLSALERLGNLHHQRSASPDILAYSEKL